MREVITDYLTPSQVQEIRNREKSKGHLVNITRLSPRLVEIEIIHPEPTAWESTAVGPKLLNDLGIQGHLT